MGVIKKKGYGDKSILSASKMVVGLTNIKIGDDRYHRLDSFGALILYQEANTKSWWKGQ